MPLAAADDPRVTVVAAALRASAAQPGPGTYGTDARRVLAALDAAAPATAKTRSDPPRGPVDEHVVDAAVIAYMDAPRDAAGRIALEDLMRHVSTAVREAL
ncbi:hypothetical protein GCM10010439_51480 [Actinocorallia aurantiaca]